MQGKHRVRRCGRSRLTGPEEMEAKLRARQAQEPTFTARAIGQTRDDQAKGQYTATKSTVRSATCDRLHRVLPGQRRTAPGGAHGATC